VAEGFESGREVFAAICGCRLKVLGCKFSNLQLSTFKETLI
jgi:hypothetical protein